MRSTGICVKCGSREVVEITGNRFNNNHYVYLNAWGTKYALIDRYICADCGYTEEYAKINEKFLKDIERIKGQKPSGSDDDFV